LMIDFSLIIPSGMFECQSNKGRKRRREMATASPRHCERSEAIQLWCQRLESWIASSGM
jgi:hypothetical protein